MVGALSLSNLNPETRDDVTATFRVRNVGGQALHLDQLTAGGRQGSDWDGAWADFPSVENITLQPNGEYTYRQTRSFDVAGGYFAEPVVRIGTWGGIGGTNRVTFNVRAKTGWIVSLSVTSSNEGSNRALMFTATTNRDVGPTPNYIQIFDASTGELVHEASACGYGLICIASVSKPAETAQSFRARVSRRDGSLVQAESNIVTIPGATRNREENAVAWALGQIGSGEWDRPQRDGSYCDQFVAGAYNREYSLFDDAYMHYMFLLNNGQIRSLDRDVPIGALAFFDKDPNNGDSGHVMLSLGSGNFVSTSVGGPNGLLVPQAGTVGLTTVEAVVGSSGPYLGWSYVNDDWLGR